MVIFLFQALIFHKLDFRKRFKLELVCHRWKNVVISHGWFDFKILELFHYTPSTKKVIIILGKTIYNCFLQINTLLKRCGKYLTELNLHDVRWSDCGLMDRLSEMPNLRHISLGSKCETIHSRITSEQLSRIAHLYPQLLSLNIWRGFHVRFKSSIITVKILIIDSSTGKMLLHMDFQKFFHVAVQWNFCHFAELPIFLESSDQQPFPQI